MTPGKGLESKILVSGWLKHAHGAPLLHHIDDRWKGHMLQGWWMKRETSMARPDLQPLPMLAHETVYVGIDSGKKTNVAGFISTTLLQRHQRFERCPALSFSTTREGFCTLVDRICSYVPLTQVYVVMEVTGHYPLPLLH